ncbi:MAG TPA: terpene cyclase/mutase family protein, partial [Pirellulales bacterium]|nr:terpene cyclase/mutase family protein [Pirellulales bacterium]
GRDPAFRGALLAREGGTSASEAAVARALAWLEKHQNSDGSWSLNRFDQAGDCHGRCGDPGTESDTAATALALLPFLGSGQTHLRGNHTVTVARGLRALIDMQRPDGDLRGRGNGNMYAHGQATIALCEAYALTQAENLRQPAQRAVDFIVSAQHAAGGWRYRPGEPGDLSVVGWQMMALRSAQMAYLQVPPDTFLKATRFLNSVQRNPGVGQYGYMPGGQPTLVMTAEGLLCRQYASWRHNNPVLRNGVFWLQANHLPRADRANMYYWYYGTQVMHHMGGEPWGKWNGALRDLLISLQSGGGHEAGSWPPLGGHDATGGRLYTTALAACTLEVYYRHLPLYGAAAIGNDAGRGKAVGR